MIFQNDTLDRPNILSHQKKRFWSKNMQFVPKITLLVSLTIHIELQGHVISQNPTIDEKKFNYGKNWPTKKITIYIPKRPFSAENIVFLPKRATCLVPKFDFFLFFTFQTIPNCFQCKRLKTVFGQYIAVFKKWPFAAKLVLFGQNGKTLRYDKNFEFFGCKIRFTSF